MVLVLGGLLGGAAGATPVRHALGTAEVGGIPRRIVVLEYSFADALLSVGVRPVGLAQEATGSDLPYLDRQLGGVAVVGSRAQPSLEKILALKPDLIVADLDRHKALYGQLSKIAPTLVLNSRLGSYSDILAQSQLLAGVVGREKLMAARVRDHQALLNKVLAVQGQRKTSLMVVSARSDSLTAFDQDSFVGSLVARLGRPNPFKLGGNVRAETSLEGLLTLNPDTLILLGNKNETLVTDGWARTPLWRGLSAVKANRVYPFDRNLWTKGRGLLAANLMLGQLLRSSVLTGGTPRDQR